MDTTPNHSSKSLSDKYQAKHVWIRRYKKRPKGCEHFGIENKRFHWANVSGKYLWRFDDYISLCRSCHFKYDKVFDKAWKKRHRKSRQVKLTKRQVIKIREESDLETHRELGKKYGVSHTTIGWIVRKQMWKHVT